MVVQVVTAAAFHPINSDMLGYSTSKSVLCLMDLRKKDLSGRQALVLPDIPQPVRSSPLSCR
jgi:hypothetical protein